MIIAYSILVEDMYDRKVKVRGIFDTTGWNIKYSENEIAGSFSYTNKDSNKVKAVYEALLQVIEEELERVMVEGVAMFRRIAK